MLKGPSPRTGPARRQDAQTRNASASERVPSVLLASPPVARLFRSLTGCLAAGSPWLLCEQPGAVTTAGVTRDAG